MKLKKKLHLKYWHLVNIDITNKNEIERINRKFDYLLCLGVLHHIEDSYKAFENIITLLKPRGYLAVGLYNTYGRLVHNFKKIIIRNFYSDNLKVKKRYLESVTHNMGDMKKNEGVWQDQFFHPYEITLSADQVLKWFKENSIEFCHSVPSLSLFQKQDLELSGLWFKQPSNLPLRIMAQLNWIYKLRHDGYFIMFGRSK
jgi:2-polyprenyl-3-methyl-5-hydroxy-6-metoxy-1,4-benzoquinol methylase